jgi:alpha-L-fucosidase 2
MKVLTIVILVTVLLSACNRKRIVIVPEKNDLHFTKLASGWDEAIPLGNGMLGLLVWQKGDALRFSLDRADLWDLRPMPNLSKPEWKYSWVYEQWKNNNYKVVQEAFDRPYDELPAPSKIPAGAVEFNISEFGEPVSIILDVSNAVCEVKWKNGVRLLTFVHASEQYGWYRFENLPGEIKPRLLSPAYNRQGDSKVLEMSFFDLDRLGYEQGRVTETGNTATYIQDGWGGFRYKIFLEWENIKSRDAGASHPLSRDGRKKPKRMK